MRASKRKVAREFMAPPALRAFLQELKKNQIIRIVLTTDVIGAEAAGHLANVITAGVFSPSNGDPYRTVELMAVAKKRGWEWEQPFYELRVLVDFHSLLAGAVASLLGEGCETAYVPNPAFE